ncbi:MAG: lanthionine synthetase LanC family protein [Bdellovibrionales bacterium]
MKKVNSNTQKIIHRLQKRWPFTKKDPWLASQVILSSRERIQARDLKRAIEILYGQRSGYFPRMIGLLDKQETYSDLDGTTAWQALQLSRMICDNAPSPARLKVHARLQNLVFEKAPRWLQQYPNFDVMTGLCAAGLALLGEPKSKAAPLEEILHQTLWTRRERYGDYLLWRKCDGDLNLQPDLDLGIAHGIYGIFLYLGQAASKGRLPTQYLEMANEIVRFSKDLYHQTEHLPSLISRDPEKNGINLRRSWCYGDLSAGISLLCSGALLNHREAVRLGRQFLKRSLKLPNAYPGQKDDPSLCHGLFGNAVIYELAYHLTQQRCYLQEAQESFHSGVELLSRRNEWVHSKLSTWYTQSVWYSPSGLILFLRQRGFEFSSEWLTCLALPNLGNDIAAHNRM